jgi:UDP-N-acetylglucosamine acyltransferase
MAVTIHPLACVSPKAILDDGVVVGPFAVVEDNVRIGKNTRIDNGARIAGRTTIGADNHIYNGASVGTDPQDLKYKGEDTELVIGDRNRIREFCTINKGTVTGIAKTVIGDNNLFMAYCHVAHDCVIGNDNVFANNATLAGHVVIGNNVVIGGISAMHQFVRVGDHVMVGGMTVLRQDAIPYTLIEGNPAVTHGLNVVGLRRRNFSQESILEMKKVVRIFCRSELSLPSAFERARAEVKSLPETDNMLAFLEKSERGYIKGKRGEAE